MELTLTIGALLLGVAGMPHCAAMCGPACAMVAGRRTCHETGSTALWGFLAGRLAGYAVAGALAAAGVGLLSALGSASPVLRPAWTLLHVGALGLGLWLLAAGRQPAWMSRAWVRQPAGAITAGSSAGVSGATWQPVSGPRPVTQARLLAATGAGAAWVAWPCGLLQSALVSASLANSPAGGAGVMAAFALSSAVGLVWAPWVLSRVSPDTAGRVTGWAVRAAGALLALGSAWALGHDAWRQVIAYCFG